MNDIYLSPTAVIRYETCPYQQDLYRQGWRQEGLSDTLHFGNSAHAALEAFHRAEVNGEQVDLGAIFEDRFLKPMATKTITYGNGRDRDSLLATGLSLMEQYPERWRSTGLHPFVDQHGPLVERKYRVRLTQAGVILVAKIDLAAVDDQGKVFLIDHKTPGQSHDTEFTGISDQLLVYQPIFEAHAHEHGVSKINGIGIQALERRKVSSTGRGKGPLVQPPDIVPRRSDADVQEYFRKVADIGSDIRAGRHHKRSLHEHNSPCKLCEYAGACRKGDFTGLVNVKQQVTGERDAQRVAA